MTVRLSRINSELNYDGRGVGKCGGDGGVVPGGDLHDSPGGARRGWRGHKASKRAYGSRGHRLAPVLCNSRFVGGATMPTYRICTVGSDGSLIAGEDIECADDQEAIEKASQAAKDGGIELWQRDRCVIQLLPAPSPNWNFPSVDSDEGSDEL
jgi:hypothetical protein